MDNSYLTDLFINEAKAALDSKGGGAQVSDEQINAAVENYLEENPIEVEDELPVVTSDDKGKVLRVSTEGAWAAENLINAEEVSY